MYPILYSTQFIVFDDDLLLSRNMLLSERNWAMKCLKKGMNGNKVVIILFYFCFTVLYVLFSVLCVL